MTVAGGCRSQHPILLPLPPALWAPFIKMAGFLFLPLTAEMSPLLH